MEQVILVDEKDIELGVMEKIEAHKKALLHRAFSVFIFNSRGELLLQQRSINKYHSGGLWTNTCCSHPRPGEDTLQAATRRLKEEMGFDVPLEKAFTFIYKTEFVNGLSEHEFDHVFVGYYDGPISPNPQEVESYISQSFPQVAQLLKEDPARFTTWFHIAFPQIRNWWDHRNEI
ncbi:isopentenyl-diphosphate Delta-isomerase [Asinibacterium sp. OR53]|uniref:isopentenyl-diphosphate Delta-isomerase n=1 Tax=Asinibacterium sp. OR53 TaxID=925409 RepID=UPI00047D4885|nr:isopentenyl-diphosphate Delta-isomerase [Asinibacterium sp. OR53]